MMANGFLKYKDYWTKIEFDIESQVLYGKIEGITDLVDFFTDNAKEIEKEFHDAVDSYLAFCEEVGKVPEKPYKGTFNVRISPELHRLCAMKAAEEGKTLNQYVNDALVSYYHENQIVDRMEKTLKASQEKNMRAIDEIMTRSSTRFSYPDEVPAQNGGYKILPEVVNIASFNERKESMM